METLNEPTHPTDYRLVKLMDGTMLMGTISVDDTHMRIVNPLELVTIPRMTDEGLKEDTTLSRWIPFTDEIEFVIAKEKFLVITLATPELAHYYEVVLDKIQRQDNNVRPALSAADIDKILDIAEEIDEEENMWDEEATNVIGGHIIDSKKLH
tara:strand:+ start:182 stop:640 length:459 start_codon:yes stop_codon:yes gene_type:complete